MFVAAFLLSSVMAVMVKAGDQATDADWTIPIIGYVSIFIIPIFFSMFVGNMALGFITKKISRNDK